MATLKSRIEKWRKTRSVWQKAGDIFFWMLLLMLVIPGPRKVISTNLNRLMLHVKTPGMLSPDKQVALQEQDYRWTLRDGEGNPVSFEQFRDSVVLLNFWATWCPPCVAELPEIQRSFDRHGSSVSFVLVTDQEPGVVAEFLGKRGYRLPVYYSSGSPPPSFVHRALPTTYIVSRQGRIVVKKTGAVNWDSRGTDRIFEQLLR